jgi:hypothetical protein
MRPIRLADAPMIFVGRAPPADPTDPDGGPCPPYGKVDTAWPGGAGVPPVRPNGCRRHPGSVGGPPAGAVPAAGRAGQWSVR